MRTRQALKIIRRRICHWSYRKSTYEKALRAIPTSSPFKTIAIQMDLDDKFDAMHGSIKFFTESWGLFDLHGNIHFIPLPRVK